RLMRPGRLSAGPPAALRPQGTARESADRRLGLATEARLIPLPAPTGPLARGGAWRLRRRDGSGVRRARAARSRPGPPSCGRGAVVLGEGLIGAATVALSLSGHARPESG